MRALSRVRSLERLRGEAFDVLVVGGGISGAAVARDAARRGLRTGLVEARDFAAGTSSRSSRLIHGGLRYLEHFEFDLVFEASQERRTLLRIAPHLVRPLEFLFPIYATGRIGKVKLDAGMWLYDALSLFRNIERHQMLDAEELLAREPRLRAEGLLGGARYFDAQVDDARLVVLTALDAAEAGAAVASRVEAVEVDASDWPGHRVRARDTESGAELPIDALAVVNATGPWADETRRRSGIAGGPLLAPSRGSHIQLRRERIGHSRALIFESPEDGRIMFVLPWRDHTIIGTTDDFHDGPPGEVAATPEDVRYLLDSANRLFPAAALEPSDVLSAWAGLRPLVAPERGEGGEEAVSRDFRVHEEPPGLFTLAGGKLTSNRAMAEEVVDRVVKFLARAEAKPERRCDTAKAPLPGGGFEELDSLVEGLRRRCAEAGIAEEGASRLGRAYGTRAHELVDLALERPELARPILEGRPHIRAEAAYGVRAEMALHVEDVLFRRTRVGLETREETAEAAREVASVMGEELGWDGAGRRREVARALEARERDDRAVAALARAGGAAGTSA